ncbi:rhodanese-like domain-containing protein [Thalassorhabdus alkalitolerans]|uniref:Rhodanese-like domain-containing protein n=1 Tax=Thalassorhabdus alkalitolerans TaxID=2282697 RepID=A0ABW0YRL0_9BACI
MSKEMDGIKQLSYEELKEIYEKSDQDKILVDVREIDEYIAGHIPRIPLIPMSEIAEKAGDFDKSKEHIFICRSGRRSQQVALFFQSQGITSYNFSGGMLTWEGPQETGEENIVTEVKDIYK